MFKKHFTLFSFLLLVVLTPSLHARIGIGWDETRVFPVIIVVDEDFCKKHHRWAADTEKVTQKTFNEFEKSLKIKFETKQLIKINLPKGDSFADDFRQLQKKVEPPKNGVVIWLSSRKYSKSRWVIAEGRTDKILGCYAAGTDYGKVSGTILSKILIHELCHLFGARDTSTNSSSIMYSSLNVLSIGNAEIDPDTAQIILRNKWRHLEEEQPK